MMDNQAINSVAIIGAGVAGLATARSLQAAGIDCTLFERGAQLGGVWSDGYLNFGVQVQRELYEFPDWPLPPDTPDFTPGPVIQQYLCDFADRFGISANIRFDSRVIRLVEMQSPQSGWLVEFENDGEAHAMTFDRVVICTGLYSQTPHLPEFPGNDQFNGDVFHNARLKRPAQLEGKRVAIIGYGKGASDAAVESARLAQRTHLVFREAHWPIPQKLAGLLPFKWGLLNRLCSTMIPPYQHATPVERMMQGIGKPLAWFYWRIVETLFYFQYGLGSRFATRVSLVPTQAVEIDAFGESTQVPKPEFFRLARAAKIELHRTAIDRFDSDGLRLANGEKLDVDTVIFATGWESDFSYLSAETWSRLEPADDGFYLYRHILHPNVAGLCFVGRAASISSILTYCLQARWLTDVFTGRVSLPPVEDMHRNIEEMRTWKRSTMPFSRSRSARLIAHSLHYHDELLKDLGENPLRKKGLFAPLKELIFPYQPADYAAVVVPQGTSAQD
jgi:dimethylaniline monooxygenase (N-oxide forming)